MRFRGAALALLTAGLAACSTAIPAKPPVPIAAPAPPCTTKLAHRISFHEHKPAEAGQCVTMRGLVAASALYENGAEYHEWQGWRDVLPPSPMVSLIWASSAPAALKTHPQFIEVTGVVVNCLVPHTPDCQSGSFFAISVIAFAIIPTAMD